MYQKKILGLKLNCGLALISWVFAVLEICLVLQSRTHLCPGLNAVAKTCQQIVFTILGKRFEGNCYQKCIEETANIVRITNSTRIASCSKNFLANNYLLQFQQKHVNRNCLQKSKEVCQNRRSNKKFHWHKKHPHKYRKTNLPGQVDFLAGYVTLKAHLPNRQQAPDKSSSPLSSSFISLCVRTNFKGYSKLLGEETSRNHLAYRRGHFDITLL